MRKTIERVLAFAMTFLMLFEMMPAVAYAEAGEAVGTAPQELTQPADAAEGNSVDGESLLTAGMTAGSEDDTTDSIKNALQTEDSEPVRTSAGTNEVASANSAIDSLNLTSGNLNLKSQRYPYPYSEAGGNLDWSDLNNIYWHDQYDSGAEKAKLYGWKANDDGSFESTNVDIDASYSAMEYTFYGVGSVSFDFETEAEPTNPDFFDGFMLVIDGKVIKAIGNQPSNEASTGKFTHAFDVPDTHTIVWMHVKDFEGLGGKDRTIIRNLQFTGENATAEVSASINYTENGDQKSGKDISVKYGKVSSIDLKVTRDAGTMYNIVVDGETVPFEGNGQTWTYALTPDQNHLVSIFGMKENCISSFWQGSVDVTSTIEEFFPEAETVTNDREDPWVFDVSTQSVISTLADGGTDLHADSSKKSKTSLSFTIPAEVETMSLDAFVDYYSMVPFGLSDSTDTQDPELLNMLSENPQRSTISVDGSNEEILKVNARAGWKTYTFTMNDHSKDHTVTITLEHSKSQQSYNHINAVMHVKNLNTHAESAATSENLSKVLAPGVNTTVMTSDSLPWRYDEATGMVRSGNPMGKADEFPTDSDKYASYTSSTQWTPKSLRPHTSSTLTVTVPPKATGVHFDLDGARCDLCWLEVRLGDTTLFKTTGDSSKWPATYQDPVYQHSYSSSGDYSVYKTKAGYTSDYPMNKGIDLTFDSANEERQLEFTVLNFGGKDWCQDDGEMNTEVDTFWIGDLSFKQHALEGNVSISDGIGHNCTITQESPDNQSLTVTGGTTTTIVPNPLNDEIIHIYVDGEEREQNEEIVLENTKGYTLTFITSKEGESRSVSKKLALVPNYGEQAANDLLAKEHGNIELTSTISDPGKNLYWAPTKKYEHDGQAVYAPSNSIPDLNDSFKETKYKSTVNNIELTVTGPGTLLVDCYSSCSPERITVYDPDPTWGQKGGPVTFYDAGLIYGVGTAPNSSTFNTISQGGKEAANIGNDKNYEYLLAHGLENRWKTVSFNVTCEEGQQQKVYLAYYKSFYGCMGDDVVAISNIRYVNSDTNITIESPTNGTVTAKSGDRSLDIGFEQKVTTNSSVELTAMPNDGFQFYGWENAETGESISGKNPYSLQVTDEITVRAVFGEKGSRPFRTADGAWFADLDDAFNHADVVILAEDLTIDSDKLVPVNKTLIIPYGDEDETGYSEGGTQSRVAWNDGLLPYKTLTVPANRTMTVEGNLVVGGVRHYADYRFAQGLTSGEYSKVECAGTIRIASGGQIDVNGLITGEGTTDLKAGGTLKMPYLVTDFAGGSITEALYFGGIFPFSQYATVNVQNTLSVEGGSTVMGTTSLYVMRTIITQDVPLISTDEGLIHLPMGSKLTITYNPAKAIRTTNVGGIDLGDFGRTSIRIDGDASAGGFSISTITDSFGSSGKYLDLPYTYDLTIERGTFTVRDKYRIMPGAEVTVDDGATLKVAEGGALQVLDGWHHQAISNKQYPTSDMLQNAGFGKSGSLTVNGTLYVMSGATFEGIVQSDGATGVVRIAEDAIVSGVSAFSAKSEHGDYNVSYDLKARASNGESIIELVAGGSYYATGDETWDLDSFTMNATGFQNGLATEMVDQPMHGTWVRPSITYVYGHDGKPNETDYYEPDAPLTLKDPGAYEGHTFKGWYTVEGANDRFDKETMPREELTLYARWDLNTYPVTFKPDGGTFTDVEPNAGEDYEQTYEHGAQLAGLPTVERDGYDFAGWQDGEGNAKDVGAEVTGPMTLTAQWTKGEYKLSCDLNDGEGGGATWPAGSEGFQSEQTYTIDAPSIEVPDPVWTGHTFLGWLVNGAGTPQKGFVVETGSTGNLTLTAQWQRNQKSVTWDLGDGTIETRYVEYGEPVVYGDAGASAVPERAGYEFVAWEVQGQTDDLTLGEDGLPTAMPDRALAIEATWSSYLERLEAIDDFASNPDRLADCGAGRFSLNL